jgi:hypothetical protein
MEDDNEKKPPLNEHQQKEVNRIMSQAISESEVEQALRTEPRFVNFFQSYNPASVESFIRSYKWLKSFLMQHGKYWLEKEENETLQWINAAQKHLGYIQQKKLFDAQCLWRAEQLSLPEVEITTDFEMWEHDVLHCPFIEPLTASDVDLYVRYLQQDNIDFEMGWFQNWQDYREIKEAYHSENENRNFPEWYEFHINNKGGSYLLSLPDVRGEKENFYMSIAQKHYREQNKEKMEEFERTRDKRPFLQSAYDATFMRYFISTFENKELLEYYNAYRKTQEIENREEIENIIRVFFSEKDLIPIEAHYDWREAIRKAYNTYKAKKIAEFLPDAFEEYELHLTLQIQSEGHLDRFKTFKQIRDGRAKMILLGRELNGEPLDFNF